MTITKYDSIEGVLKTLEPFGPFTPIQTFNYSARGKDGSAKHGMAQHSGERGLRSAEGSDGGPRGVTEVRGQWGF